MPSLSRSLYLYQFLGAHSLLIGLLPFFLPVYLWKLGLSLAGLSLLIGVSGISFALALYTWQRLSTRWPLKRLVALTFVLETALVFFVGVFTLIPGVGLLATPLGDVGASSVFSLVMTAIVIGIFNGVYNAFFWTTQRTLFLQQLSPAVEGKSETGRQYGNFQIFVTLFLKLGILLGGWLLDAGGFVTLLAISAGVSAASNVWLARSEHGNKMLHQLPSRVGLVKSLRYKDQQGSSPTFAIDGIFLYLDSHFWTLSLFMLVKQDFSTLGVAVVLLALGFAVLFFLIKNGIDRLDVQRVFKAAVILYSLSWLLRFTLDDTMSGNALLINLLVVTFFSSFFRLAFNKRFFDVARSEGAVHYLLYKSFSSQFILGLFFILLGSALFFIAAEPMRILQGVYLGAALLSLIYLLYQDKSKG